jgi:hypothetical protein
MIAGPFSLRCRVWKTGPQNGRFNEGLRMEGKE